MKISKPILDKLKKLGRADKAVHLALLHYLDDMEMYKVDDTAALHMAERLELAASARNCEEIDVAYNVDFDEYVPLHSWVRQTAYTRAQLVYYGLQKVEKGE